MKKYRVYATRKVVYYRDIEANFPSQARDCAEHLDAVDFIPCEEQPNFDMEITDTEEINKNEP